MSARWPRVFVAAMVIAVSSVFASSAEAVVQIPIELGPTEPLPKEYEFGTPDVRAGSPFTIRAYPQGVENPAEYGWNIRAWQWQRTPSGHWDSVAGGASGSCSVMTGSSPEITLSLPPGSYEVGVCVNESGDWSGAGYWAYCHHELNVVPAGPQARFSMMGPSSVSIEEFLEGGTKVSARWNRPVRTVYRPILSVNVDGMEMLEYPLRFSLGEHARKRTLSSGKAKVEVTIAPPGPGSAARQALARALSDRRISASVGLSTDVTKDPSWGGLVNLFDVSPGVNLTRVRLPG